MEKGKISGIVFEPWNEDGWGEDRLSYFRNMYGKLKTTGFTWEKREKYYVIRKN